MQTLGAYAPLWRRAAPKAEAPLQWTRAEVNELGWIEPGRYVPLARIVTESIVPSLRSLGLVLPQAELAAALSE